MNNTFTFKTWDGSGNTWTEEKDFNTVLEAISAKYVFDIVKEGDTFDIIELCDRNFSINLTKEQLNKLSDELKILANNCT